MGFGHESPNKGVTDDWWTPLDLVYGCGEFDLDPCGNKKHITAKNIYEEDGLENEWFGRVWMNPPYSQNTLWVDKFIEYGNGVALLFARTDTNWCQKLLATCDGVYFIDKRVKFLKSGVEQKNTGGAPSALFYFGTILIPEKYKGVLLRK